jgi:hypothetical protein
MSTPYPGLWTGRIGWLASPGNSGPFAGDCFIRMNAKSAGSKWVMSGVGAGTRRPEMAQSSQVALIEWVDRIADFTLGGLA